VWDDGTDKSFPHPLFHSKNAINLLKIRKKIRKNQKKE